METAGAQSRIDRGAKRATRHIPAIVNSETPLISIRRRVERGRSQQITARYTKYAIGIASERGWFESPGGWRSIDYDPIAEDRYVKLFL